MKLNRTKSISVLSATLALALVVYSAGAERSLDANDAFGSSSATLTEGELSSVEGKEREGRSRDRDRRRGRRLSEQDLDAAHAIVARLYPEVVEELAGFREEDPRKFRRTLEQRFPRVRFLVGLEKRDPAMFELRMTDISLGRQTAALAKAFREANTADDDDRADQLYDQIEAKVAEHFDIRQKIRAMEIEKLKQKLEELEETLDDRDDDRKDLIEQRVNELTGKDW